MSNVYNGVAMDFGLGDPTITAISTQIGTFKLQDWDVANKAEVDAVKDGTGATVTRTYYDPHREATFTYYVSGTGLANAITQSIIPALGTLATVVSASYAAIAGTNWSVEDSQIKATNTKNKMVTLKLMSFPAITAAASA